MKYGMLEFSRVKRNATEVHTVVIDGLPFEGLTREDAERKKHLATLATDEERARVQAGVRVERAQWLRDHTTVHSGTEQVSVTTYRSETRPFEEIEVEGVKQRVEPGTGKATLQALAEERFPYPEIYTGIEDSVEHIPEERTWNGWWSTGGVETSLAVPPDLDWRSIPTHWVIRELDRLSRDGWDLVEVSTDRGIYGHSDSGTQGAPVTLRYLLRHAAEAID